MPHPKVLTPAPWETVEKRWNEKLRVILFDGEASGQKGRSPKGRLKNTSGKAAVFQSNKQKIFRFSVFPQSLSRSGSATGRNSDRLLKKSLLRLRGGICL